MLLKRSHVVLFCYSSNVSGLNDSADKLWVSLSLGIQGHTGAYLCTSRSCEYVHACATGIGQLLTTAWLFAGPSDGLDALLRVVFLYWRWGDVYCSDMS
jgi:hypothetical protein